MNAAVFLISVLALIGNTNTLFAADLYYPKLFFSYSYLFDERCPAEFPIDPAWADEAKNREREFSLLWEREAPALFGQVFARLNKGFSRKEMTATLSVCPDPYSMSNPLVIDVIKLMRTNRPANQIWPDHGFIDLVFHELLHTWVVENVSFPTTLIEKYKNELRAVRSHLHLMAIQKMVYLELGRQDLLQWTSDRYRRMGGAEGRAWEIVDSIEGHAPFIAEILNQPSR